MINVSICSLCSAFKKMASPIPHFHLAPLYLFPLFSFIVFTSCTSTRELQYFQDVPAVPVHPLPPIESEQRTIQKNDRLLISFGAQDVEAAAIFNKYGGVSVSGTEILGSGGEATNEVAGFIVDQNGYLDFPIIGKTKVEGLTIMQLKDSLLKSIKPYLKNPLVVIKFIDFKVTVLGEVKAPGTYSLTQNKPSIFHALGASGDLSRTGKRYDLQLFRDYNGTRSITKIDLRSKELLSNPQSFYLRNNDVLYVQPRKGGLAGENFGIIAGFIAALISAATLIVTINK